MTRKQAYPAVRGGPKTNDVASVFVVAFLIAGLLGLFAAIL